MSRDPNIWILDIETAPKLSYVWKFFKENISPKMVLKHCYVISYAAKKLGESKIIYEESRSEDDSLIIESLVNLLDDADLVIAHNGGKFDLPTIKGRALVNGVSPPSPYQIVDTCLSARREFNFESNSLEYLAMVFGCSPKMTNRKFPGFELWSECLAQNEEAWDELREYNIQDILTLEEVYLKMRPWISNHPNIGVYKESEKTLCPKCGSDHVHFRGYAYTSVSKFRRFQCQDCGGWGRMRFTEYPTELRKALGTNAV